MSKKIQVPKTIDEHAGKGGSYVVDEATGTRTLVHRTEDMVAGIPAADDQPETEKKG